MFNHVLNDHSPKQLRESLRRKDFAVVSSNGVIGIIVEKRALIVLSCSVIREQGWQRGANSP